MTEIITEDRKRIVWETSVNEMRNSKSLDHWALLVWHPIAIGWAFLFSIPLFFYLLPANFY